MAKHMAGKNQRPYSAEDRARRAAKADPRSAASELTPETLYAKQSSQSEKRVPSSIENLHFTPKSPKNGPEGFEETREYPAPAAPQQEAPRSERPAPAPAPRPEPYEDEDDYEEYEEYEEGYDDKPRRKRSPVVPIVIVMIVLAIGILGYIAYSLGAFGKLLPLPPHLRRSPHRKPPQRRSRHLLPLQSRPPRRSRHRRRSMTTARRATSPRAFSSTITRALKCSTAATAWRPPTPKR